MKNSKEDWVLIDEFLDKEVTIEEIITWTNNLPEGLDLLKIKICAEIEENIFPKEKGIACLKVYKLLNA